MDDLFRLLRGELTPAVRIWSAAAPALVIVAYFVLGAVVYAIRGRVRGPFRDAELATRGSSVLIGMAVRHYFAWVTQPIWGLLRSASVPATALTTLSALLATAAAIALAMGRFALGGWIYVSAGLCDFFDGRLARAQGSAGPIGAALDSILDRYSDAVVLIGLGWYYRDSWVLMAVMILMVGSALVPYIRAKGEGLGVKVTVGLMQRPERTVYLGVSVALSPILEAIHLPLDQRPEHFLAALAIAVLAVTTGLTAVQRFRFLLRALAGEQSGLLRGFDAHGGWPRLLRFMLYSGIATIADFACMMFLVRGGHLSPWVATVVGCGLGALVNAVINRYWAFGGGGLDPRRMWRYGFVSASSALLNGGGVALLLSLPGLDYRLAWGICRLSVLLFWNYPINRDYLFAVAREAEVRASQ